MGESTAEKLVRETTGMWWPAADADKLRQAAGAWKAMAEAIDDVTAPTNQAAQGVIENNHGPAIDAFQTFWGRYYGGGKGWLPDTAEACRQMAKALDAFADEVDKAVHKLEEEAAIVGATLVAGTALAFFTAGISEAAAGAATAGIIAAADALGVAVSETVASIAATTLTGVVFGSVESVAVDVAVAQPVRIAFGDGGFSGTEILSAAETGGFAGGAAGALGSGARALGQAAEGAEGASTTLASIGKISAGLDTIPGRMATGALLGAGQDAVFNGGHINPLDLAVEAVGGAAAPGRSRTPADLTGPRIAELKSQGHAPGRHVEPDDATLQRRLGTTMTNPDGTPKTYTSSSNNAGHVKSNNHIDPLTGTTVDGDTGGIHKCGPYATRYNDPKDLVAVDDYMRNYIKTHGHPPTAPLPIEDVLGPDGYKKFTGFYKDPSNPNQYLPVDFEGGTIVAIYVPDGNGGYNLLTSYANPAPGKHP